MAKSSVELQLFGSFELSIDGERVNSVPKPTQELFAHLAIKGSRGIDRIEVASILWPEVETERAQFYLRRSLTNLRSSLGSQRGRLEALDERRIAFNLDDGWCDLVEFDAAVRRKDVKDLEEAAKLYSGELLSGHKSEWVRLHRDAYREKYLQVLCRLAGEATNAGQLDQAQEWLSIASAADPVREETCRQMMTLLGERGDFAGIANVFRELRLSLKKGLGLPPSRETADLYRELLADARLVAPPRADAEPSPLVQKIDLPSPAASFIGRVPEQASLEAMLAEHRLVSLTGLGGVGKSRLAVQVAKTIQGQFESGVAFADLSVCKDDAEVPERIARALGVPEGPSSIERIAKSVTAKTLLVLDEVEHVVRGCGAALEALLKEAPNLTILCTSQVALHIRSEYVFVLNPLGLPDASSASDPLSSESVAFFLACAKRATPAFQAKTENLGQIVELCRRLDGLPLALELAAVRLRTLPIREIVANLDDRFRLLGMESGGQDRRQTLEGVLDWSFQLLPEEEETLFVRLGLFPSRWTVAACQSICSSSELPSRQIPITLAGLVEHSLVSYDVGSGTYRMLETVRTYANRRLSQDLDTFASLKERFADYYLESAGSKDEDAFDTALFLLDEPNFTASIDHFLAQKDSDRRSLALRLVNRLFPSWYRTATLSEGLTLSQRVIAAFGHEENASLAEALFRAAGAAHYLYRIKLSNSLFERAEKMADALGLEVWSNESLRGRAELAANEGRLEEAEQLLLLAAKKFKEADDPLNEAACLRSLGYVKRESRDFDRARSYTEAALGIYMVYDNVDGRLWCLGSLAAINLGAKEPSRAVPLLEETLALQVQAGNRPAEAWNLTMLGKTHMELGEFDVAESYLNRALTVPGQDADDLRKAWPKIELGDLHRRAGRLDLAKKTLAEALKLSRDSGSTALSTRALLRLSMVSIDLGDLISARAYRSTGAETLATIQSPQLEEELAEIDALLGKNTPADPILI